MKKSILFISLVLITALSIMAQSQNYPRLTGPYLGQKPPGKSPEIFAPGILSTNMNVAKIAISPDGKEIFFRLMSYDHSFTTIIFMREDNGVWSKPEVAPFSGKYNDGEPFFSLDGKQIFFNSNRSLEGGRAQKDYDIWVVERTESGWTEPVNLGLVVNSDKHEVNPAVSQKGNLYFASNREGGKGGNDIYVSRFVSGEYTPPQNLGDPINTVFTESGPFIAPDESYIIFNRFGSDTTSGLHISFRKVDGSWTEAQSMENIISTENSGFHAFVSTDNKYLFYTSSQSPYFPNPEEPLTYDEILSIFYNHYNGSYNIYWVDAIIIEELKLENDTN